MCEVSILSYLDDIPEEDRRYAHPVQQKRVNAALKALGTLVNLLPQHTIIEVFGEIGLIECVTFVDDFTQDRLALRLSDVQAVAAAAALGAVYEYSVSPESIAIEEVA